MKHFRGFGRGFTELHAKLDADTSFNLSAIADKTKQEVKKHLCKSNVCSQHGVTWQTDAVGLLMCGLGLHSHLLSPRQLQQSQSGNFLVAYYMSDMHLIFSQFQSLSFTLSEEHLKSKS
jgi:hypothetical protein